MKKILYTFTFILLFLLLGTIESKAGYQRLNNLDFNVQINNDGSMDVTETWDIYIDETNTLFKNFETDNTKYSEITNVTVKELTNGKNNFLTDTKKWEYHVKKDCYYGTKNKEGNFEIGWGVGLDNSSDTRKYQISYKVRDSITKYNDFAELYWQFIGKDFEIDAKKITGTIYLPSNVKALDNIKVWGHTEGLNGTIYATGLNKIEFEIDNFRNGKYVEIRTLFPSNLITYAKRTKNANILEEAVLEETRWAEEANIRREKQEKLIKTIIIIAIIVCITINILLIILGISKAKKYSKKSKELIKYKPEAELKYYRDLPDKKRTPGEAMKILDINIQAFDPMNFGKIFSAVMLNLSLKGYLEISQQKDIKGKDKIKINIIKKSYDNLKSDERNIMEFILKASKNQDFIELKELEKYIKKHTKETEELLSNSYDEVNNKLIDEEIINEKEQDEYKSYIEIQVAYVVAAIFLLCFVVFAIPGIIFIIDAVLCGKVAKKLNVLTQKGIDEKEKWKGLKKFMEDFSMLDRREVPELVIWEKYLVFATAFGIADKVIKQLKIVYPNLEEMTSGLNTYTYMNLMVNTNFSSSFTSSMTSSISSAFSSGSGGGGGFSGGGGFGRWPEAAAVGR